MPPTCRCRTRRPRRRPPSRTGRRPSGCGASVAGDADAAVRGRPSVAQNDRVETFAETADERRGLADLLSGLTAEQRSVQSLCSEWSVQEVVAHLVVPLQVGIPEFVLA